MLTDLPPEEADPYLDTLRGRGLDTIFLAAPTTSPARMKKVAAASRGFIYLISRAGVTGAQEALPVGRAIGKWAAVIPSLTLTNPSEQDVGGIAPPSTSDRQAADLKRRSWR